MAFSYQNYTGDNTTTTFSIPFTYTATSEISVTVDGVAQTGLAFPSASQVTLTSAPASNTLVQVRRTTSLTSRAVDFASGSVLTEEDLDNSNIQTFHASQEAVDKANDGITLDADDKWDAQSKVIKNVATPTTNTDGATKAYVDVVAGSASAAANSASQAASSASNAATSATNAATSETNAATSATTSTTQANNAAGSATSASTSATTATTQANNASASATASANSATASANSATAAATSETNASTSETNAATSASNASTSETNAAGSATAAAATFDLFDDAYLGAKSSNPSVDNDGNALQDGALYFDTTNNVMKVYDLGSTTWFQLTPTVSNQTNINTVAGISSEVTAVAGDAADIGTLATDINGSNNIGTVSGAITNVNLVGGSIANVNTVATNMADVNSFANTYFISANAPASPTEGDLWFDTTNDVMKVYDGSGFVNAGSSVNGTSNRTTYTATAGQQVFNATYDAGFVDVYLNGVKLINGTDFTATNGSSISLTTGAAVNDTVDIVGYGTFELQNTSLDDLSDVSVASATSGQFLKYDGTNFVADSVPSSDLVNDTTPQLGGDLQSNNNDVVFADNDKAIFGAGSDLQIYHDGSNSYIIDGGTGDLVINTNGNAISLNPNGGGEYGARVINNGAVELYHDNSKKLETTSSGITVTGQMKPTLIAFQARLSSNISSFNTSTQGLAVAFNVTDYNNGSAFNTSGSDIGLFTCPINGMYAFDGWIYSSAVSNFSQIWLVKNGTREIASDVVLGSTNSFVGGNWMIKCNAGDKIGLHPYNGSTSVQINFHGNHTYFRGHLVTAI